MLRRSFLTALSAALLFTALSLPLSAAEDTRTTGATSLSLSAECACLYLPQKDLVLYGKQANKRHPMASTTKIMTALVVIEETAPYEEVVVSPDAVGIEGSSVYLRAGEHQTVENLLYALLLSSANDAAAALAIYVGGSIEGFAELMNRKAEALALADTHFKNPHGLADPDHYTTAEDLARITAAAMEHPLFRTIVSTKHKVITTDDGKGARSLSNHNRLLRSYEDCVGVKTGFTRASGRCLVSAAERDGMLAIAVTLDAPDDWRDHAELLDYGFSVFRGCMPLGDLPPSVTLPVIGGTQPYVTASAEKTPFFLLRKDAEDITARVEAIRMPVAPIHAGDVLGKICYYQNGRLLSEEPLLAEIDIPLLPTKETLWDRIKKFLNL